MAAAAVQQRLDRAEHLKLLRRQMAAVSGKIGSGRYGPAQYHSRPDAVGGSIAAVKHGGRGDRRRREHGHHRAAEYRAAVLMDGMDLVVLGLNGRHGWRPGSAATRPRRATAAQSHQDSDASAEYGSTCVPDDERSAGLELAESAEPIHMVFGNHRGDGCARVKSQTACPNTIDGRDIGTLFTAPLTAGEYRILVEIKYCQSANQIRGWALRDQDGRIRGWHPYESNTHSWAHVADAFKSFVPDTDERRRLTLLGYQIAATTGIQDLTDLLHVALGGNIVSAATGQS